MTLTERTPMVIRREGSDGSEYTPNPYDRESMGLVVYKVGGRVYPYRCEPRCCVCTSPIRTQIESRLLDGAGYAAIRRDIPEGVPAISLKSLRNHARHHLPVELHMRRQIIEERAREMGREIEHDGPLIDHIALARLTVQRTAERLASGEIEPEFSDGMMAAQFLHRVEQVAGAEMDQEVIRKAFIAWAETIQRTVSPEVFTKIMQEISVHPVMRALIAERSKAIDTESSDTESSDDYDDQEDPAHA